MPAACAQPAESGTSVMQGSVLQPYACCLHPRWVRVLGLARQPSGDVVTHRHVGTVGFRDASKQHSRVIAAFRMDWV